MTLPKPLTILCDLLMQHHFHPILVGGFVRDHFLQHHSKDIDIEVYGSDALDDLHDALKPLGKVHEVGKSFGVLKLRFDDYDFDISLPRQEIKTGQGHKGFDIYSDASLPFEVAAKRRDFTINAIGYDPIHQTFLDPFGGINDLTHQCLRHVNDESFVEDPLRILRAVQFAARFNFKLTANTYKLCQNMVKQNMLNELPKERVFEEYKKLLLKSTKPSYGFELMDQLGMLPNTIKALQNVPQNPDYHPEGDVWTHTMMSIDAMAKNKTGDAKQDLLYMLTVLCHDFGKPATTKHDKGRIRSIGHERHLDPVITFLMSLTDEKHLIDAICTLIEHHLAPSQLYANKAKDSAIRRLATKVNIKDLVIIATADHLGRTTAEAKSGRYLAGEWLLDKAEMLKVAQDAPQPLLLGRHLIERGLTPGEHFKGILDAAFEAQLEGKFTNEEAALQWLDAYLASEV